MPSACATAGMSRALNPPFGSFGVGVTGATTLTDTGTLIGAGGSPSAPTLAAAGARLMVTLPCVEPTSSCETSMVAVTVAPSGGSGPLDGEMVMNGLSEATLNVSPAARASLPLVGMPGMKMRCVMMHGDCGQGSCTKLKFGCVAGCGAVTSTLAVGEKPPKFPPHAGAA